MHVQALDTHDTQTLIEAQRLISAPQRKAMSGM